MTRTTDDIYDELLVYRCQDGEAQALNELISRWHGRLLAHAIRLLGKKDEAADALQEAWVAIVRGLSRLDDPAKFRSWAYRIVTNKAADRIRANTRERRTVRTASEQGESRDSSPPDAHAEQDDEIGALRRALAKLPGDRRAILTMHYIESMPLTEIARSLGVPTGTVKSRLHHARAQLKKTLESTQEERISHVEL